MWNSIKLPIKKKPTAGRAIVPSPSDAVSRLKATPLFSPQPVVTIIIKTTDSDLKSNKEKAPSVQGEYKDHKFIIHKNFVYHHSPFFSAAFNGRFVEGQTQTMNFDDIDPTLFGYFVHWLYTQKLESDFGVEITAEKLVKLWILAERFIIPALQNQVIDKFFDVIGHLRMKAAKNIVKAIQSSGSVILNDMLLNRIPTQKDARNSWIDELSVDMLRRYAKSDFKQISRSSSKDYHVSSKINVGGRSNEDNASTGMNIQDVKKRPRKAPVKKA
ncbi:hypothetical protein VTL71DRAFT_1319 [Oculimacula yallundae]|uniref:BTB domain-containing protein n=1 Tax=Oculimacula yallundae TaxID=86028 RepID=A0ABR4CAT4_9HELO